MATQVESQAPLPCAAKSAIVARVCSLFWLKCIGSTVVISAFFVGYFWVLNHPGFAVREMPLFGIDQWLPVVPASAWVYFSLWVYICLPSSLMSQAKELGYYLMGAALLSGIGLAIFYCFPTAVPNWGIDWSLYPTLQFLKESDASGNACPSLHVAFAVYAGLWLARMFRLLSIGGAWHWVNVSWCVWIIVSTMTTKQHVFIDVLCGTVLGFCCFWLNEVIARKAKFTSFQQPCVGSSK